MGALPQAGTGLGGRAGNEAMAARRGQGAREECVLLLSGCFWALARDGSSEDGCPSPQLAPGGEAVAQERASEQ